MKTVHTSGHPHTAPLFDQVSSSDCHNPLLHSLETQGQSLLQRNDPATSFLHNSTHLVPTYTKTQPFCLTNQIFKHYCTCYYFLPFFYLAPLTLSPFTYSPLPITPLPPHLHTLPPSPLPSLQLSIKHSLDRSTLTRGVAVDQAAERQ